MFWNSVWHPKGIASGARQHEGKLLPRCFWSVEKTVGSLHTFPRRLFWRRWQPKLSKISQHFSFDLVRELSDGTSYLVPGCKRKWAKLQKIQAKSIFNWWYKILLYTILVQSVGLLTFFPAFLVLKGHTNFSITISKFHSKLPKNIRYNKVMPSAGHMKLSPFGYEIHQVLYSAVPYSDRTLKEKPHPILFTVSICTTVLLHLVENSEQHMLYAYALPPDSTNQVWLKINFKQTHYMI
jgi:hypothetical protein